MIECRHCGAGNVVKNGHDYKSKQNYVCKECGRAFVERLENIKLSDMEKQMARNLKDSGESIRSIGRMLNRSPTAIKNCL